jgi:hypothetical protein
MIVKEEKISRIPICPVHLTGMTPADLKLVGPVFNEIRTIEVSRCPERGCVYTFSPSTGYFRFSAGGKINSEKRLWSVCPEHHRPLYISEYDSQSKIATWCCSGIDCEMRRVDEPLSSSLRHGDSRTDVTIGMGQRGAAALGLRVPAPCMGMLCQEEHIPAHDNEMKRSGQEIPVSSRIEVKVKDNAVRIQREAAAQRVLSHFGLSMPESRLLCFLDDVDPTALRAKYGPANRGLYGPIHANQDLPSQLPEYVRRCIDIKDKYFGRTRVIDDLVYLYGSTCDDEVGLAMTLAHELQHLIQHATCESCGPQTDSFAG